MNEPADRSTPFWAKCPGCGHCWPAAYYPAPMDVVARTAMGAKCPKGCKDRPVVAKQTNGRLQEPKLGASPQSKGGRARAGSLTPERRSEIARAAAHARWHPQG